jgi:hypothetical protein
MILDDGTSQILLPDDLYWADELDWDPISQTQEESITGAVIIEPFETLGGRPITLMPPADDMALISRATFLQLDAWRRVKGKEMTLIFANGNQFTVIFGRPALQAKPFFGFTHRAPDEWWHGTIRFLETP